MFTEILMLGALLPAVGVALAPIWVPIVIIRKVRSK